MRDLIEFIVEAILQIAEPLRWWRWAVAMCLGVAAGWLLASAVPSRFGVWVWGCVMVAACLSGLWWEARNA